MDSFGTTATTILSEVNQNRKFGKDQGTKYYIEWILKSKMWTRTRMERGKRNTGRWGKATVKEIEMR